MLGTRTMRALASLGAAVGLGCTGGGESVISGMGNSGNHIGTAALWASLAEQLAEHEATPRVGDEDVQRVFAAVRQRALEGDVEAALVVLRLAEEQRDDD